MSFRLLRTERWSDARRIREIRDEHVLHDWLWVFSLGYGLGIPPDEFLTCLRVRLVAPVIEDA
eukprot:12421178-Karenia_brevis.AAC.1